METPENPTCPGDSCSFAICSGMPLLITLVTVDFCFFIIPDFDALLSSHAESANILVAIAWKQPGLGGTNISRSGKKSRKVVGNLLPPKKNILTKAGEGADSEEGVTISHPLERCVISGRSGKPINPLRVQPLWGGFEGNRCIMSESFTPCWVTWNAAAMPSSLFCPRLSYDQP
jgi:hypothetical protein